MLPPPRNFKKWAWIACVYPFVQLVSVASAQNFSLQIANSDPLGLRSVIPGTDDLDFGLTNGIKGAFSYGIAANAEYNSNFFLSDKDKKSELSTNLMPYLNYRSDPEGGAKVSFNASYTPTLRAYLHNSVLNGVDHTGDVSLTVQGTKTLIRSYAVYNQFSGADRLSGTYVTGTILNGGVQAACQVAPRTSLTGLWSVGMSDYDTPGSVGSDLYTTELGGYWSYSERLSFGPVIRYLVAASGNIDTRDSWSVLLQSQYLVGERIRVAGSFGLEYAANSGGDEKSNVGPTGHLMARYELNQRWNWTNLINYAMVPSPTEVGYIVNNLSVSSFFDRNFTRGTAQFGLDYNLSNYESVGVVTKNRDNENNLSVFIAYQRHFFSDRLDFSSKVSYGVNDGDTNWTQFVVSTGLRVSF